MNKKTVGEAEQEVERFCLDFKARFGVKPMVIIPTIEVTKSLRLPLKTLEEIVNQHVHGAFDIRTKTRRRPVVVARYVYYKLALDMGYGCYHVGKEIGYDHATVLHGRRTIEELLQIEDREVTLVFTAIKQEVEERIANAQLVSSGNSLGLDAEPALSSGRYFPEGEPKADQYPRRAQGSTSWGLGRRGQQFE